MFKQTYRLFIIILLFCFSDLTGQNTDSLYNVAKKLAADKDYESAQIICKQLLLLSPNNTDYKLLSGRIYGWNGKTDSAKTIFNSIILSDKTNPEAHDAITDVELWNKEYTAVIEHSTTALTLVSEKEHVKFYLKIAKAYYLSGEYKLAKEKLENILVLYPGNPEAKHLLYEVNKAIYRNYISFTYLNVSFYNPSSDPWNYASLEYKYKHTKMPFVVRANYGSAYTTSAYQVEAELYPRINKKTYLYLNAGLSSSGNIFPEFSAAADIYRSLPKAFEASAGIRYLQFPSAEVFIYTAYIGKYFKKHWLAYRPFLVNKNSTYYLSHTAIIRNYFSNTDNYISLHLIYGATPYTTNTLQDISRVNSQRVGIDFQKTISSRLLIRPMVSYEYEEYFPGLFRDRFYGQLTLLTLF